MHGFHAPHDFQPHDRREAAIAQFGFDQRQQIVGFFLVALGIGVARDAEKLAAVDSDLGKEQVEVMRDHVFERDEAPGALDPQKARDAKPDRHLHPRQRRLDVVGCRAA